MKKLLSFVLAMALGWSTASALLVHAQDYNSNGLLDRFNEMMNVDGSMNANVDATLYSTPTPTAAYMPVATQWQATMTGHVTCNAGACFLNANGKSIRLLGKTLATQILRAVLYDQVRIVGTLNKEGTVLSNVVEVTATTGVSGKYVRPVQNTNGWVRVAYSGWIIKDAQGHVFLRRANADGSVMVSAGKPVEYRLLNGTNWRLAYRFVGKGMVTVSGLAQDKKWVMRYDDNGIVAGM